MTTYYIAHTSNPTTSDGWHALDCDKGALSVLLAGGVPVRVSLTQDEDSASVSDDEVAAEVLRVTGRHVRVGREWSTAEGPNEVVATLEVIDPRRWHVAEAGERYGTIEADDAEAALEEAAAAVDAASFDVTETLWIEVRVTNEATGESARSTVTLDPEPPRCADGTHDHTWSDDHDLVGGLRENPGVRGSGGGVLIVKACSACGCGRHVDTWATDLNDGTQGHRKTWYVEEEFAEQLAERAAAAAAANTRFALVVDGVACADGATEAAAWDDLNETCIPEPHTREDLEVESYDASTHEVAMGPEGYVAIIPREAAAVG